MNNSQVLGVSTFFGFVFIISAVLILTFGHLHEDAYILFQYSKKLALGKGIVFDELSGPTEGATDFLWMALLALMHFIGLNLGTAAALINSAGFILSSFIMLKLYGKLDLGAFCILLLIIFSGGFAAALGGFSTLAYGSLILLFGHSIINKRYKIISILTLLIPLFRPDGALIVLGGVFTAFILSNKEKRKVLFFYLIPPAVLGIGYFYWRLSYFDSLLPLPLLVKAKTDSLMEGPGANFHALKFYIPLLIPFILHFFKKGISGIKWGQYFAFGLGPLFLLIALSFAHQSQNVGFRLQYPIILAFIITFLFSIKELNPVPKIFFAIPLLCSISGANTIYKEVKYLTNADYINSFPQILKEMNFKADKIAITEAGRFPFWYDSKEMIDLIGLNSGKVVRYGAKKVLDETLPELIFLHHAGRYDTSLFSKENSYLITDANSILLKSNYLGNNPVSIAPEAALKFAIRNNYTAVLVQYGLEDSDFKHVYFLSPKLNINLFIAALNKSIYSKLTYFQSLKFIK